MSTSDFEERVVTVPLRDVTRVPKHKRADEAMSLIREHLADSFGVQPEEVRLDPSINEAVWDRGRKKPPRKLQIRAARFEEAGEQIVEAETT